MHEIWKTIIEHVINWPIVALALGLIFRKPLTALVSRINSIKGPGFDLSAPPHAASAQTESKESPPEGVIGSGATETAVTPATMSSGVAAVVLEKREAVQNFAKGIAIVDEDVEKIKSQLAALDMPLDSEETAIVLIRHLAATQLAVRCERTLRVIFGSQLLALHLMNNSGVQAEDTVRAIFENARAAEPQFYGSYSFDDWIGFLIKEVTVIKSEQGRYGITVYGSIFLQYAVARASVPRPH